MAFARRRAASSVSINGMRLRLLVWIIPQLFFRCQSGSRQRGEHGEANERITSGSEERRMRKCRREDGARSEGRGGAVDELAAESAGSAEKADVGNPRRSHHEPGPGRPRDDA